MSCVMLLEHLFLWFGALVEDQPHLSGVKDSLHGNLMIEKENKAGRKEG